MKKWLLGMVVVGMLFVSSVAIAEEVKETSAVSAMDVEFLYVSRYSLTDMQFKSPMLGVNLFPQRLKYVDIITLIGTEDNLVMDKTQWQVGMGIQTNFEALDFSDDVSNWIESRLGWKLPEGLKIGPNLNPYGLVNPIETIKRFCYAVGDSSFKDEFNQDYWQNHTDGGIMFGFVKYEVTF